jgi:hypothetical protein
MKVEDMVSMNEQYGMEMVDVIKETFGQKLDDRTAIGLLYILAGKTIHFVSEIGEDGYLILEHSQRHAGRVLSKVMPEKNYVEWLDVYRSQVGGNFYETPPGYEEIVEYIEQQLLNHPMVLKIEDE